MKKKKSDQEYYFGKMFPEFLTPTKDRISELYLKKFAELKMKSFLFLCLQAENGLKQDVFWEKIFHSHGEHWTLNTSESPSVEKECLLSQILEENPHPKYSLSLMACQGVLRKASKRGKNLPSVLKQALEEQLKLLEKKLSVTI